MLLLDVVYEEHGCRYVLLLYRLLVSSRGRISVRLKHKLGTKAEARFAFISDKAPYASDDLLDV